MSKEQNKKKILKNLKPSEQLLKTLKETEDIVSRKIKTKGYRNIEDLKKALLED